MTILVSIYPALLTPEPTDPVAVRAVYSRLGDVPGIGAVELPLDADGDLPDADLVLPLIPAHWDVVLTTVPGTMARMAQDAAFGLASPDDRGGDAAVDHLRRCLSTAAGIDARLGRRAVTAIGVVSAPTRPGTTAPRDPADEAVDDSSDEAASAGARAARFGERLAGVLATGTGTGTGARTGARTEGIRVLVEHCDARVPGQPPAKGFLDLAAEIDVVATLRAAGHASAGLVVNWGRSALETRSARGPVDHVDRAARAGVLTGVVLSGCADRDGAFGPAWADAHPPLRDLPAPAGEPTSLLSDDAVRATLAAAGPVDLVGVKVAVRPHDLDPAERASAVVRNVERVMALAG